MNDPTIREVRYDRFRRTTAKRMTESVTTKPHVSLHRSAELTALEQNLHDARVQNPGATLGFTPALLAVIATGVTTSRINGTVVDRVINLHDGVDLGVAVDVDGALVVPVVRSADRRTVEDIGADLTRLVETARSGRLRPEDVADATFTVSSLGPMGVEYFTPIINPPQLAILGIGAIRTEVTLADGVVGSHRRIGLSLSFDHAATDGADAARALDTLCRVIEAPPALRWAEAERRS
ncbi:2-oxo acid dehydrogenase subunit E2 (plasmid) [Rhodococcus erythropolis]|uniref:2-oxo acid dehydrogenase subunit E2 n=1 Tax=Rhodococcus erythropolis TaxID=1833 RepID=UPI00406BD868